MERVVSAADANRRLSELLRNVREGQSYVVTAHGRPIAKIVPVFGECSSPVDIFGDPGVSTCPSADTSSASVNSLSGLFRSHKHTDTAEALTGPTLLIIVRFNRIFVAQFPSAPVAFIWKRACFI